MFPTANSIVYHNDAGEIIGWDNLSSYGDEEYGEDFYLEMEYEDRFYVPDWEEEETDDSFWDEEI